MEIQTYTPSTLPAESEFGAINNFLFYHLDQYGDKKEDIAKAMHYSLGTDGKPGGFVIAGKQAMKYWAR